MDLPMYLIFGDRPVKFVATEDGGMDVLAFDWGSGEFVREHDYLSRYFKFSPEMDVVGEAEFEDKVAALRGKLKRSR